MTDDTKRFKIEVLKDGIARYKDDIKRDRLAAIGLLLGGTVAAAGAGAQMVGYETVFANAVTVLLIVGALGQGGVDAVRVIRKQKQVKQMQTQLLELQKQLQK